MINWIDAPSILAGKTIDLIPMSRTHFPDLRILSGDKRIWQHYAYDGSDPLRFQRVLDSAIDEYEKGTQCPFVIFHKDEQKLIGSTRFLGMERLHRKLEIGSTWMHPDYWGSPINLECKLLLLTFCFETLHTMRVQFKTDENNTRSRKAIEKIGGSFEGILRNDILRDNKTKRHSAYYSIIEEEWPEKKIRLIDLLEAKLNE